MRKRIVLDVMNTVPTFTAAIYAGFKERETGRLHTIDEAREVCRAYCDEVGLCVTLTPTEYVYTDGGEPGCVVGLINYPRFPSDAETIRAHALTLARRLLAALGQMRMTAVFPDETVMLSAGCTSAGRGEPNDS